MMPTSMSPRPLLLLSTALITALLAACSTPGTRVVLLPQADGKPSAVVVRAKDGEEVLSKPYQRATAAVGASGAPVVDQADAAKVQAENKPLFDMRPPPPQRYTVFFEVGGTTLTPASQQIMTEALAAALARSGGDIVVTGHTDTKGSGESNDQLSRRRAQEVVQLFVERQFPANRVEAVGRGERDLAVPTADEVDEPRNRRVTIEVR
ncbi:outer membrane protein OmpA-like peptidoglycan-associated protein [Variovorax boronicumulans]|uniref:Outer membrane protein OmpA-like peptidoglycan-associated protein n=1 Tax=Variovorax boronicumulans TaxID=436515 RepID=A0AAW8CMQ0_9BURK|nr:OmpA family protein [Variovorax boronicumulans]MDP9892708.1 outer membrane protein OmpA-like peptidoglycan-associated protein [Variovorax boronicumulans]MDQ0051811.1 outer membrane protein OmpA-like peptidoglycan-associated protein [Variovorax boronicumulans]